MHEELYCLHFNLLTAASRERTALPVEYIDDNSDQLLYVSTTHTMTGELVSELVSRWHYWTNNQPTIGRLRV